MLDKYIVIRYNKGVIRKEQKIMLLQNFKNKYENEIKKGQFTSAKWQSVKVDKEGNEYKKVSNGVVRLVQYSHIKGVEVKGKVNPNEEVIIPNTLYFNAKTNNYLVQLATTETKAKSTYYLNGQEIDKETYELANPPRQGNPSPVFRVKLENLLELGD